MHETPLAVGQCRTWEENAPVRYPVSFSRSIFVWRNIFLDQHCPIIKRGHFKEKWENFVFEIPPVVGQYQIREKDTSVRYPNVRFSNRLSYHFLDQFSCGEILLRSALPHY